MKKGKKSLLMLISFDPSLNLQASENTMTKPSLYVSG